MNKIDTASVNQLAGLLSGNYCIYLTDDFDVEIHPVNADSDGAFSSACGQLRDLAINGLDSYNDDDSGYPILAEAVELVGMPEGYDDLDEIEENGMGDSIRAQALRASPQFMNEQRSFLKGLVDKSYIAQVYEEVADAVAIEP